jgi:GntR family transcriptional regulator
MIYGDLRVALRSAESAPRYIQVATVLRKLVERGALSTGDALPSERDLSAATQLSRVTVRKAIEELQRDGVLSRRHGSGTFVARRIEQPSSVLAGFSEDMRSRGSDPGSIWLSRILARPTPEEVMALGVRPDEGIVRLSRVRTADGEPLAIEHAVVPAALMPSTDFVGASLYAALAEQGHRPATGIQHLRAAHASDEEARLLLVPIGSAILRIELRSFLENGRPVEFTRSAYRGDRYDFVATMTSIGRWLPAGSRIAAQTP